MGNEIEKSILKDDDELSFKELIPKIREWWRYLWSRKLIIIIAGVVGGALGLGYAFIKKPVYTATTTFVLESGEKSGGLGAYAGVASMMGIDLGGGGGGIFQGDNIIELYKSNTMIKKTLFSPIEKSSKQLLIERYILFKGLREKWEEKPELKSLDFGIKNTSKSRLKDSVVSEIVKDISKNYLNVDKPDRKLSIIKVDVKSNDEFFAKHFNDELVKNVNDFYIQTKSKKALNNIRILQHKTDSVRAVMNGEIYNAAIVSDATPNLNPTRQVQRAAPVQRAQFSAETNKTILAELVKNLEMANISLLREMPLIQIVDEPQFPLYKVKTSKIIATIMGGILVSIITIIILLIKKAIKEAL